MSVSISVVAQVRLSAEDYKKLELYNSLLDASYKIPEKLEQDVSSLLGKNFYRGESASIPKGSDVVEIGLSGNGNVMYDDGMIVKVADIPSGTVAIRIYASS